MWGWEYSEMRTYINTTTLSSLPKELQDVIVDTTVVSSHGPNDSDNFTTTDKLYLLATHEVGENTDGYYKVNDTSYEYTRQLDYYKKLDVKDYNFDGAVKKDIYGSTRCWWMRSAYLVYAHYFYYADTSGDPFHSNNSIYSYGFVSPAFRIG